MANKCNSIVTDISVVKKRRLITLKQKVDIINRSDNGEHPAKIANALELPRSTVMTIIKNKVKIQEYVKKTASMHSTVITKPRCIIVAEMEKLLVAWLKDQTRHNLPLSLILIQEKAKSVYRDLKEKYGKQTENDPFIASRGWFNRFKVREGLHNIKVSEETSISDADIAKGFSSKLATLIKNEGYSSHQVFNVDETGLYWKKMPSRTYISKEDNSMIGFTSGKDRVTLLVGGNAAGDYKLKPMVVYQSETPKAFKGHSKSSLPVIWKASPRATVTKIVFLDWFTHHFVPSVELYCAENNVPFKILLVLDKASSHPIDLGNVHKNIRVIFLPSKVATLLQPMKLGIIATFKAYYMRCIFTQAIQETEGGDVPNLETFWKSYNMYNAIMNISKSWNEITSSSMNSVWKKLCPNFVDDFQECSNNVSVVKEKVKLLCNRLGLKDIKHEEENDCLMLNGIYSNDISKRELTLNKQKPSSTSQRELTANILLQGFQLIEAAITLFEENDPNIERSSSVKRELLKAYRCYKDIYEEKYVHTQQQNNLTRDYTSQRCESETQVKIKQEIGNGVSSDNNQLEDAKGPEFIDMSIFGMGNESENRFLNDADIKQEIIIPDEEKAEDSTPLDEKGNVFQESIEEDVDIKEEMEVTEDCDVHLQNEQNGFYEIEEGMIT